MLRRNKLILSLLSFTLTFASVNCFGQTLTEVVDRYVVYRYLISDLLKGGSDGLEERINERIKPGTVIIYPRNIYSEIATDERTLGSVREAFKSYIKSLITIEKLSGTDVWMNPLYRAKDNAFKNLAVTLELSHQIAQDERRAMARTTARTSRGGRQTLGRGKAGVVTGAIVGIGAAAGGMGRSDANASEADLVPVAPSVAQ